MDEYCTNGDCVHARCHSCHSLDPNLKRIYGPGDSSGDDEVDQDRKSDDDDSGHDSDNGNDKAESRNKGEASEVSEEGDAYNGESKSEEGESVSDPHDHAKSSNRADSRGNSTSASSQSSKRSSPTNSLHDSQIDGSVNREDETSDGETFDYDEDIMGIYGDMLENLGPAELFNMH